MENSNVYLCQDIQDGMLCKNKLGYNYSWEVNEGSDSDLLNNNVLNFKIIEQEEEKKDDVLSRLPKYWAVKGDQSKLFISTLKPFFMLHYDKHWNCGTTYYYGYDGRTSSHGTFCRDIKNCQNNPTVLTLQEFINLTTNNTNNLTIKENNHEKSSIKVQRKTPVITRGKRYTGNPISGGRSKVAISIGHLSNSAIYK